jgi:hypothetical protein
MMHGKAFAWAFAIMIVLSMLLSPVVMSSSVARAQSLSYLTYSANGFLPTDAGLMWVSNSSIPSYDTGYYYVLLAGTQLYIYNVTGTYPDLQLSSNYVLNYTIYPPDGYTQVPLLVGPYNSTSLEIIVFDGYGVASYTQTFSTLTVNFSSGSSFYSSYLRVYTLDLKTLAISNIYSVTYSVTSDNQLNIATYSSLSGSVFWNMSALSSALYYAVATVSFGSPATYGSSIANPGILISSPDGTNYYGDPYSGNEFPATVNWISALYDPVAGYYVALVEGEGYMYIDAFSGNTLVSTNSVKVTSVVDTLTYTWYAHAFYGLTSKGYSVYMFNKYGGFIFANGSGTWKAYQQFSFSNPSTVAPLSNTYATPNGFVYYYGPSGSNTAYQYMSLTQNGASFAVGTYTAPTQYNPALTWIIFPAFITYQPTTQTLTAYGSVPFPQPAISGSGSSSSNSTTTSSSNSTTTTPPGTIPPPPSNTMPTSPSATTYYISSSVGIMIIVMLIFLPAIVMAIYVGKIGFIVGLALMIAILTAVGYLPLWVSVLAGLALLVMIWRPFGGSGNEGE